MKTSQSLRGAASMVAAFSAALALIEIVFPALAVKPTQEVQQMTMTSMTGMMSSTQMMTTMTSTAVTPIPGFPIESIFLGLILALSVLMLFRRRGGNQRLSI